MRATRQAASQLQASPAGFGTARCHQPKGAGISGASLARRRSRDPRSLGGWGSLERDALPDPRPGCRAAEQAPGSPGAGGEACEWLGEGSPLPALPGGQRAALSPACPPFAPCPRGRALAQPAWAGQGGRCHPSPGRPWGPSSMSQGHLLETTLEIRHPPRPWPTPQPKLGFTTLAFPSGTPQPRPHCWQQHPPCP